MRNISQISNELELCLDNLDARTLIQNSKLPIVHEINPKNVIELNVSLKKDVRELNERASDLIRKLQQEAHDLGGRIYGGSSLLEDVSNVSPRRYRTTSLSDSCAEGFLDITSQQIVLGVNDEELGFELFNYLKNINPVLLALSASSPYRVRENILEEVGAQSRRISQYEKLCRFFPEEMWRNIPEINSLEEYFSHLQNISNEVNRRHSAGELDSNEEALAKFLPFERLEPHQIYWPVRIRPDHGNIESGGSSVFSLEVRILEMPTTIEKLQMMNNFVLGISYYIADYGSDDLFSPFDGSYEELQIAANEGLQGEIKGVKILDAVDALTSIAIRGLEERNYHYEANFLGQMIGKVIQEGNDAQLILNSEPQSTKELKDYLVNRLLEGENSLNESSKSEFANCERK